MAEAQFDFAAVDAIDAESIGEPGKRTFRIRILRGDDAASLWLEKQQLDALGEAIPRLLDQLTSPDQHSDENATPIYYFPDDPTVEFKVSRLALGYAQNEDRLVLVARDIETDIDEEDEPDVAIIRPVFFFTVAMKVTKRFMKGGNYDEDSQGTKVQKRSLQM